MKRIIAILFCFSCLLTKAQQVKYVVLVSIDGLRPDFYKEANRPTPNLQQMKAGGVYAEGVRSVFPSVTYPSHTTIITGALPAKHGIYYNEPFEPAGQTGRWYWEANLVQVPTLWDAIHKAGLTSAAVSWPVTVGAPIDHNIPEIWPLDKKTDKVTLTRQYTTPEHLLDEIEQNATGKLTADDLNSDFLTIDENIARMGAYLIRTYKPNLTAIHLVCVDHNEHMEGREGDRVNKAIASADRAVGKLMEAVQMAGIKDSTAFIITGDHGFVDIHTMLSPNVWLVNAGIISATGEKKERKAVFHTTGGSAFLQMADKNDKKTLKGVKDMLGQLPASRKKLFRIVEGEELQKIGADPGVALALSPVPGVAMNSTTDGADVKAAHGGTHGYYPDFKEIQTGIIGYGPGFNKNVVIAVMGLEDIAPVISELLHLNFVTPDGVLYPGILANRKNKE